MERPVIRESALAAFWLLAAAIGFVTLAPIHLRPQTGHVFLERFAAFLALGAAFVAAYPNRTRLALVVIPLIAVALEAMQTLVPSRHGEVLDALEKVGGGLTGIVVAAIAIAASERNRRQGG